MENVLRGILPSLKQRTIKVQTLNIKFYYYFFKNWIGVKKKIINNKLEKRVISYKLRFCVIVCKNIKCKTNNKIQKIGSNKEASQINIDDRYFLQFELCQNSRIGTYEDHILTCKQTEKKFLYFFR